MAEDRDLTALLARAADTAGGFAPPPLTELTRRWRRRARRRAAGAVLAVAATVAAVAVGVSLAGGPGGAPPVRPGRSVPPPTALPDTPPVGPEIAALEHYRWQPLPQAPVTPREGTAAAWSGSRFYVWGGDIGYARFFADGASYDPASRTWQKLPAAPLAPRSGAQAVWAGDRLVVWGGSARHAFTDGAVYDPATRTWTALPPAPDASPDAQLVASGSRAVLLGAASGSRIVQAAVYDPAGNTWSTLPALALPRHHDAAVLAAVDAGSAVVAAVGWDRVVADGRRSYTVRSGVELDVLSVATGRWARVPGTVPSGYPSQLLWTGSRVVMGHLGVWCGPCSHPDQTVTPSVVIDPASGRTRAVAKSPNDYFRTGFVWTGRALLATYFTPHSADTGAGRTGRVAAWSPATDSWTQVPAGRAGAFDEVPAVVWTGRSLLVWGRPVRRGAPAGYLLAPR